MECPPSIPRRAASFFCFVGVLDVFDGERHHHAVGMMRCLLVHGIDQIEGVLGKVSLIGFRINPDGEKFRTQVASASFVEADVSDVGWVSRADVKIAVQKTLRSVGMCIDHDRRLLNGSSASADNGRGIVIALGQRR